MGSCCCKPPDDDDEHAAEEKPIKDEDKTGSYGTIEEKRAPEDSAETTLTPDKKPSVIAPEDETGVLEGAEAASEATPLLESQDVPPEESAKKDGETTVFESETIEEIKDTTSVDDSGIDVSKGHDKSSSDTTITKRAATTQIDLTSVEGASGTSSQTTPQQSTRTSISENEPLPSPSEEGLQVPHYEDGTKKKKSVGQKIKKKFTKLGSSKRKRSSKSTSSTGSESGMNTL